MKSLILILLFMTSQVFAAGRIRLHLASQEFKQGAIVKGVLKLDPTLVNLPVSKLKGSSFAETIYFHQISPLLKKENSESYESEVQVIFIRVPETNALSGKIGNDDVVIEWDPATIIPVEAPGQMLWADFTAPDVLVKNWHWLWIIPIIIFCLFFALRLWRHFDRKAKIRAKRKRLRDEIIGCADYDDVVAFWKKKHTYLSEFPQMEDPFRKFETVLFKYQFKPSQTEDEKNTVLKAYRELLQESEGGLRGV